jgi:hypothetical protein
MLAAAKEGFSAMRVAHNQLVYELRSAHPYRLRTYNLSRSLTRVRDKACHLVEPPVGWPAARQRLYRTPHTAGVGKRCREERVTAASRAITGSMHR